MHDVVEMLFVYGTLKPGERNYPTVAEHIRAVQPATIGGILIDRGSSPGLVEGPGIVQGVLLSITSAGLEIADKIEAYHPGSADSLYLRRPVTATLDNGSPAPCWTYYFGDPQSITDRPHCVASRDAETVIYAWPCIAPRFE